MQQKKDIAVKGSIVTPTRYYVDDSTGWKQVTQIVASGMNASDITSVHISSTINYIGGQAFGTGLQTLTVSDKNTTFKSVEGLNCLLDSKKTTILFGGSGADLSKLPNTVTTIGDSAFYNSKISSINIPSTITTIEGSAFFGTKSLEKINIPSSVTKIGTFAFNNSAVTEVSFADTSIAWKQINGSAINISNSGTNATNLKNCAESKKDNWGYTGIQTAKVVLIKVDSTTVPGDFGTFEVKEKLFEGSTLTFTIRTKTEKTVYHTNANLKNSIGQTIATVSDLYVSCDEDATFNISINDWSKINDGEELTLAFETDKITSISLLSQQTNTFYVGDLIDTSDWVINAYGESKNTYQVRGRFDTNWDADRFWIEHVGKQSVTIYWHQLDYATTEEQKITVQHKTWSVLNFLDTTIFDAPDTFELKSSATASISITYKGSEQLTGKFIIRANYEPAYETDEITLNNGDKKDISIDPEYVRWQWANNEDPVFLEFEQNE